VKSEGRNPKAEGLAAGHQLKSEGRNPKAERRPKSEGRNPKSEGTRVTAGLLRDSLRIEEQGLNAREACAQRALRARPGESCAMGCLKETQARLRLLWRVKARHCRE
jgi:hypothetical protein